MGIHDYILFFAVSKQISEMTLGEVREIIAKSLASPEHVSSVMEGLFEKGSVLYEKRKLLVEKYKKKRKAPVDVPQTQPAEVIFEGSSQDVF